MHAAIRDIANISSGYVSAWGMSISYLSEIVIIQNAAVGHLRILQTYIIIIMAVVAMVGGPEKE